MRLTEFTPSRTQFSQIIADPSLRMGFECEVILPQESDDSDGDYEINWEMETERINNMDWDDIQHYVRRSRIRDNIHEAFFEWLNAKVEEEWDEVADNVVLQYCKDNGLGDDEDALEDKDNIDAAKEEWENNEADDIRGEYDMDDFIKDEYRTMSRFASEFDIEIEPDDDSYERIGINAHEVHREAAESLSASVGKRVIVGSAGASSWHVEEDGSLEGDGTGMEIISPVFTMNDGLAALQTVFEWIDDYDASTNATTGLHVSFSIEGKREQDYDYLKMIVLFDENYTADLFKRMTNNFAQQMRTVLSANLNSVTDIARLPERSIDALVAKLRTLSPDVYSISEKYFSFRHRAKGVFEFRTMGNAGYEQRFEIIRKRIVAMAAIMKVGADPTLMVREYLSRIYQMLTSERFAGASLSAVRAVKLPPSLSLFGKLLTKQPEVIEQATTDPRKFLMNLAPMLAKVTLTAQQIRQLRFYVKRNRLTHHMFDQRNDRADLLASYNTLANYLRWPLHVPSDDGQGTLPFVRSAPMNSEHNPYVQDRSLGDERAYHRQGVIGTSGTGDRASGEYA